MGAVADQFERFPAFARQLRLIEENLRHPHHFSKGLWRKDPKSLNRGLPAQVIRRFVRRFDRSAEPSGWKAGARGRGRRICGLH